MSSPSNPVISSHPNTPSPLTPFLSSLPITSLNYTKMNSLPPSPAEVNKKTPLLLPLNNGGLTSIPCKVTMNTLNVILAPLLCAAIMVCTPLESGSKSMLAVLVWVFTWWISEAVPMPVTSMAPLFLFPIFGIASADSVSRSYTDDIIVLVIGSFIFAIAVEHYSIHRRIALNITLLFCGDPLKPRLLLLGLCATSAFLSMWIHNIAAAVLMMPVATGILSRFPVTHIREPSVDNYSRAVILAVIYAVPIGGMSTLTGTGVNLILVGMWSSYFPNAVAITFNNWFFFGFPSAFLILFSLWVILSFLYCSKETGPALSPYLDRSVLAHEIQLLGPLPFEEKAVLSVFSVLIVLWMTRSITDSIPGWGVLFHGRVGDGSVSVMMATLLFIIPDKKGNGGKLMDWEKCKKLQWGIILLLGAGLAIADGVRSSGLADVMSEALGFLEGVPVWAMTPVLCIVAGTLTEFITSNNATALLLIPILIQIAITMHIHPLLLMIPGAMGAQFSFILPTATPSNTVGFTTGHVEMKDMVKTGFLLKVASVVVVSITMPTLGPIVFPVGEREVGF